MITHGSVEYREMVALRYRVLREPLGLDFAPEQLAAEAADILLAAFMEKDIVGSLILTPRDSETVQMRQVAVEPALQGKGIGAAMVRFAEEMARERGYAVLILHARESALKFYEKLGYERTGEPFFEVGLPHFAQRKMLKPLAI